MDTKVPARMTFVEDSPRPSPRPAAKGRGVDVSRNTNARLGKWFSPQPESNNIARLGHPNQCASFRLADMQADAYRTGQRHLTTSEEKV